MGERGSVRRPATVPEEMPRLNTKNFIGSPTESTAARRAPAVGAEVSVRWEPPASRSSQTSATTGTWREIWKVVCSTIPYCDHPAEMITGREDGCYCSERAYTRPPPCTVVPQGTDVGQPVAAGVARGHTWYNR